MVERAVDPEIPQLRGQREVLPEQIEQLPRVSIDGEILSRSMREIADWVVPARTARLLLADAVTAAGLLQQFAWGHEPNIAYLYLLHIRYIEIFATDHGVALALAGRPIG